MRPLNSSVFSRHWQMTPPTQQGRSVDSQDDAVVTLRGIVGSGVGSLNPAYVIIVVDAQSSTIGIAAHAKEGLIKQRTAQKAIAKVRSALDL